MSPTAVTAYHGRFLFISKNTPTGLTKAFIDFTLSDQGKQILDAQGLIHR